MAEGLKKLTKLKTLRWRASERRAVEALLADWKAVVAHLKEEAEERTDSGAAAQGFLTTLASARFVSLLHSLLTSFTTWADCQNPSKMTAWWSGTFRPLLT